MNDSKVHTATTSLPGTQSRDPNPTQINPMSPSTPYLNTNTHNTPMTGSLTQPASKPALPSLKPLTSSHPPVPKTQSVIHPTPLHNSIPKTLPVVSPRTGHLSPRYQIQNKTGPCVNMSCMSDLPFRSEEVITNVGELEVSFKSNAEAQKKFSPRYISYDAPKLTQTSQPRSATMSFACGTNGGLLENSHSLFRD